MPQWQSGHLAFRIIVAMLVGVLYHKRKGAIYIDNYISDLDHLFMMFTCREMEICDELLMHVDILCKNSSGI